MEGWIALAFGLTYLLSATAASAGGPRSLPGWRVQLPAGAAPAAASPAAAVPLGADQNQKQR